MKTNRIYKPIKKHLGWYFVEYHPPINNEKFAQLFLVILEITPKEDIAIAMEKELREWLNRYPVPLFVCAFDNTGSLIDISETRPSSHLIGFFDQNGKVIFYWKSLKSEEIPDVALNQEYVNTLYADLPYTNNDEYDKATQKKRQNIKSGWIIFFVWLVIIPIIVASLDYYSNLVSLVALIYSIYQAIRKGLELIGKWPKSRKEKGKEREEQLKNHYYYHCQMNPEGFRRLMQENLERIAKEKTANEAEAIK